MTASIFVIVISTALMVYWLRYACLLLLHTRSGKDYVAEQSAANRLVFSRVQERLPRATTVELDELQKMLERDYVLLKYLIKHTAGLQLGGLTLEQRLLMLDFRLMQVVSVLTRKLMQRRARTALFEMSEVLAYLANDLGVRAHAAPRA